MKYLKSLMLVAVLLTTGCQAKEQVETPNQNLGTEQKTTNLSRKINTY